MPLGSVHASALLARAEASSGEFLLRHFGSSEGIVPVVRRLESKFRKPAQGSVTSSASAKPEALARLPAILHPRVVPLFSWRSSFTTSPVHMRSLQQWNGSFNAVPRMTQTPNQSLEPPRRRQRLEYDSGHGLNLG